MNKKLAFLVCLLAIFGLKLSAQEETHWGIFFGGSVNMMNIDKSFYYDDSEVDTRKLIGIDTTYIVSYMPVNGASVKPNGGFVIGGFFEYKASEMVGLHFELLYNQYGYKLTGTVDKYNIGDENFVTYDYSSNLKMSNFSAALLVKIHALDFLSVDLGVQPSYCFRMIKESKRGIENRSTNYDSKNDYNPLNFSATGGLTGYWGDVFISARYTLGFTDVLKVKHPYHLNDNNEIKYNYSDAKSTTSSVQLTVGYRIK